MAGFHARDGRHLGGGSLYVGPDIEDTVGQRLDQDRDGLMGEQDDDVYDAAFAIGVSATKATTFVASLTPSAPLNEEDGFDHFVVSFSNPVHFQTFTSSDLSVTGPDGALHVLGVVQLSSTTYQVNVPVQKTPGV